MSGLRAEHVRVDIDGKTIVDDVSLAAEPGQVLGLIGPNGAGKTTLFNVVTGFYPSDEGTMRFDGHRLNGLKPNQITTLGIARTFQAVRLFPNMTVLENAMVGQHCRTRAGVMGPILRMPGTAKEEARIQKTAREALGFFGDRLTGQREEQLAAELAYADRRRLEIARAMATEPRLLLLDEPTAGMTPVEKKEMITLIGRLREERGYAIVLIEHDMPVVKGVSDRVVVLDYGSKIAEGTYQEVSSNQRVIEAYLGKQAEAG
jgi:branched-chain amino acid transport system ATP-binding protein